MRGLPLKGKKVQLLLRYPPHLLLIIKDMND